MWMYIWLVWHGKLELLLVLSSVYCKFRWCSHVKWKHTCASAHRKNVYLIISVDLVKWCNWCKSTSCRLLFQNSSSSFCYCDFSTSSKKREASLLWLIWSNSPGDWKNSLVGQLVMPNRLGSSWDLAAFSSEGLLFWISLSRLVL